MTVTSLTDEQVAEMKAAAGKATPGPWKYEGSIYEHMGAGIRAIPDDRGLAQIWQHGNVVSDAAHIANCDPDTILSLLTELTDLRERLGSLSSWLPIETALKVVDETVLLRVEHVNYAIAAPDDKHRWEEVCTAYWTDFNSGGWVWHGLAGSPTHWMPIPPRGAHP